MGNKTQIGRLFPRRMREVVPCHSGHNTKRQTSEKSWRKGSNPAERKPCNSSMSMSPEPSRSISRNTSRTWYLS